MNINTTDVVGEYLREVDHRLYGLPLLQRRELIADLQVHIETSMAERGVSSPGEVIDILERLGSPEVVAAAAYEEAGPLQPPVGAMPAPAAEAYTEGRPAWLKWLIAAIVAFAVFFVIGLLMLVLFARAGGAPAPEVGVPVPVPAAT